MATLWSGKLIDYQPKVYSTVTCDYAREGRKLKLKVNVDNWCTESGAYWDYRWAFNVVVNGKTIGSNITIKEQMTGHTIIANRHFTASSGWATVDIGTATSVRITVNFFDTNGGNYRSSMGSGDVTMGGIPALPKVSLSASYAYANMTHNSLKVNYSVSGSCNYITVYVDGKSIGNKTNSPFTVTGLSPNTKHTIYAKGYGNGGYGDNSNTLTFTTFVTPVKVGTTKVDDIEPFTCSAYCTSNNAGNTQQYEFALCDENKRVLQGGFATKNTYYNFTGLNEETSYYIRYRVQTKGSGAWSEYIYSPLFKTPADQVRAYGKISGSYKKGKAFVKINGQWVKAKKAWVKIGGNWHKSMNKYD